MLILTMPIYPGRAYRPLNAVIQFETVGIASWRDWVTKVTDIVGGRAKTYDRPILSAMQSAIDKLERAAADLGGDAIIDLHIEVIAVSSKGFGMSQLLVTGTAIAFEVEMPLVRPTVTTSEVSHGRASGAGVPSGFSFEPDVPQLGPSTGSSAIVR